ncbi:hypothetical protein ABPG75_007044 [Micractinium tetrahymenae]
MAAAPADGAPPAPQAALPASALPLAVRDGELVVGGFPGGASGPLLAGLAPSLTCRGDEGGCLVLGLDLGSGARPLAQADVAVGQLRGYRRFLALSKTSLWWMSPRWGAAALQVPVETQFLLLELDQPRQEPSHRGHTTPEPGASASSAEGSTSGGAVSGEESGGRSRPRTPGPAAPAGYALMLPLIDSGRFRATLRPPKGRAIPKDSLCLRLESGSPAVAATAWPSALLVAAGRDPYELTARAVAAAARLSGIARPRTEKPVPPSADVFGWCTWDAFYSMVSAAGIAEGLRTLGAGGTPPRLLIIDDGWQQTDVDPAYRQIAVQRHLVGQVSVPHTQSELELEDAVMDLVIGPADERETNTRHTVNKEEEEILGFTPRALTPRKLAAANPFARTPRRHTGLLSPSLLSPRRPLPPAVASASIVTGAGAESPRAPEGYPRPSSAAAPASPLRPPPGLAPIVAERLTLDEQEPVAVAPPLAAAAAAEPAAPEGMDKATAAALEQAAEQQAEAEGGLLFGFLEGLHRAEAQALRLLKAWLDAAPSDSWRFRAFSSAATGLLRPTLLRFYAHATEHTRRLAGIRANAKFSGPGVGPDSGDLNSSAPEPSLGGVIAHLKERFGLTHVFMWHALLGFWAGVAPAGHGSDGSGTDKYQAQVVVPRPTPGTLEIDPSYGWTPGTLAGVGLPSSPRQLHSDMHDYLKGCGADGVKVDVQGMVAHAGTATEVGGPALAAAYHASLEDSAARCFGSAVINCMCGSTENMYNLRDTNLGRCSDDFYPRNRASFTTHISTCAFNSLFCGEIFVPDWDMFHSKHSAALLHATARAISGGPVYCSDKPGQHDFGLLRRLVLRDGSVLRCLLPGRPTPDCLFLDVNGDGHSALKVWNMNRCTGVLAAFNGASWSTPRRGFHFHSSAPSAVTAHVSPADVPGLVPLASPADDAAAGGQQMFVVYIDSRQELLLLGAADSVPLELAGGGSSEVLTLSAVRESPGGGPRVAPIGLTNMLNAGGAVVSCGWAEAAEGGRPAFRLSTRGHGLLLAYCSQRPAAVAVAKARGIPVPFAYHAQRGQLSWEVPASLALEVDWELRF